MWLLLLTLTPLWKHRFLKYQLLLFDSRVNENKPGVDIPGYRRRNLDCSSLACLILVLHGGS